ncbi:hypothetical protein L0U85_16590 [Glycomyces sp. L485]|uniref:hypothetical protein n=1 Tax=Glycomyces sp. L485 TaxID=2909235 RepID=UPI001F4B4936|nr:hypothetical protein [Glycomyces sp. L485]MCH7232458.1 hypothetical protein [Glycomyces sp. L485]
MSELSVYNDLVHELARLDADTAASAEQTQRRLARRREALEGLRTALDEEVASLAEGCAALRRPVPDLAPAENDGEDVEAVLRDARVRLREAADFRLATMRAAQRPTFLPGAHHIARELIVYGGAMVACLLGQLLWLNANGGVGSSWWVVFIPPVGAALVGYVLVGAANKPRMPMFDRGGKPIKPVVPHNPRLGVTLAVVTMAIFAYLAFFA